MKKANQLPGLIRRSFTTRNQRLIMTLYQAMVRPILEYGSVVWGPTYPKDELRIENVQRRAARLIPDVNKLPYVDRLQAFNVPSLCHRRYQNDMVQLFK